MSVGRAVIDAVGLGPVAVGKGPKSARSVRTMAVLVLLALLGFPFMEGPRNADAIRTIKPIRSVLAPKALKYNRSSVKFTFPLPKGVLMPYHSFRLVGDNGGCCNVMMLFCLTMLGGVGYGLSDIPQVSLEDMSDRCPGWAILNQKHPPDSQKNQEGLSIAERLLGYDRQISWQIDWQR